MEKLERTDGAVRGGSFELDAFVLNLDGEFDLSERMRLIDAFAVTANSSLVIVDFEHTSYVDSTVLECLVALNRAIDERGAKLILAALRPEIRRIFHICNLEKIFDIRDSLVSAMDAIDVEAPRMRRLTLVAQPPMSPEELEVRWDEIRS